MATEVIEVTEIISEVSSDLQGCLDAAMASEANKIEIRGNMHIHTWAMTGSWFPTWDCLEDNQGLRV